jgi:ABC-type amino acid transport/signal transduction systems, periplasmic component/domain
MAGLLWLCQTALSGDIIDEIKQRGRVVVAQVGAEQPPFFWKVQKDGKSEWVGYEVDLAKTIADRLGVELEILRLGEDYNEVCRVVNEGKADIGLSNLSDTEARRELVDFTKPYIVSRVAMVIDLVGLEKDGIDAIEPADLNRPDVKAALTQDSAYDFVHEELMPKANRVDTPQGDFNAIVSAVLEGRAHLVIDDGFTLFLGMDTNPALAERYFLHIFDEYDDPLSMCLPHDQPRLREFLNQMIDEIEEREPVTLELVVDQYLR